MAGLVFEEFSVGQTFDHAWRRTVSESDNILFSALTMNPAQVHMDALLNFMHPFFRQPEKWQDVNLAIDIREGENQGRQVRRL